MKCKMYIVNDKLPIFEKLFIIFDFLRTASNFCNNINNINTVVFAVIINPILAGKKVRIASPVVVAHLEFVKNEYTIKEIETNKPTFINLLFNEFLESLIIPPNIKNVNQGNNGYVPLNINLSIHSNIESALIMWLHVPFKSKKYEFRIGVKQTNKRNNNFVLILILESGTLRRVHSASRLKIPGVYQLKTWLAIKLTRI
tara:strand:+ start:161 stop:760 length:600 start_codon:yes stop_codon:yes gene_type:complete